MSTYKAFRRAPEDPQEQQALKSVSTPAPTRGLNVSESLAGMTPGTASVHDNWKPTMQGVALRGGCIRWTTLPETTPVISAFEYISGNVQRMFAANATKLYEVTANGPPTLVQSGLASGNWSAVQFANQGGDFLTAVNDAGDYPMRFDGSAWTVLNSGQITGPAGTPVVNGKNLTYTWKYGNRLFFIEGGTMNAWFLGTDAIQGVLQLLPLSGSATKGGSLLFGASWSLSAGDGINQKCVFVTDMGEALVFSGTDPTDPNNWQEEGIYYISPPLGMNAHMAIGGDLLIATMDGIVPITQAIMKDVTVLDLASVTLPIRSMWRDDALAKRNWNWTMKKWPEYGGIFVTSPGGAVGNQYCYALNNGTNAWTRYVGWDCTCFIYMRGNLFFGTQDGRILQADQSGYDDGVPYVATLVDYWNAFGGGTSQTVWHQARATFRATPGEPFIPQIASTVDYVTIIPPPPPAGIDPSNYDVWDEALWDQGKWDQAAPGKPTVQNTLWMSVGYTGFAHAPIVQVTVAQKNKPNVELITIDATFESAGVNV